MGGLLFQSKNLPLGLVYCAAQRIIWGYETMLRYEMGCMI